MFFLILYTVTQVFRKLFQDDSCLAQIIRNDKDLVK